MFTMKNKYTKGNTSLCNTCFSAIPYILWMQEMLTFDSENPVNNEIIHLSTGAGFRPSFVWLSTFSFDEDLHFHRAPRLQPAEARISCPAFGGRSCAVRCAEGKPVEARATFPRWLCPANLNLYVFVVWCGKPKTQKEYTQHKKHN